MIVVVSADSQSTCQRKMREDVLCRWMASIFARFGATVHVLGSSHPSKFISFLFRNSITHTVCITYYLITGMLNIEKPENICKFCPSD